MKRQFLILGGLSIMLILVGAGCNKFIPETQKEITTTKVTYNPTMATYKNDKKGISIDYPNDWEITEDHGDLVVATISSPLQSNEDNYQETVWISKENYNDENLILDDYDSNFLKSIEDPLEMQKKTLKINKHEDMEINGEPGKLLIYQIDDTTKQDSPIYTIQAYTIYENHAYLITFMGKSGDFEKFVPTVQNMVKSFKFF